MASFDPELPSSGRSEGRQGDDSFDNVLTDVGCNSRPCGAGEPPRTFGSIMGGWGLICALRRWGTSSAGEHPAHTTAC
jgi:hypothetical protein